MVAPTAPFAPFAEAPARATVSQLWAWLAEVPDPEIPAVSIVDLGIVRDVQWEASATAVPVITVTPTYSGCPATEVIGHQIREKLLACGVGAVELRISLSPAWTTDWLTAEAKEKMRAYGIAPPTQRAATPSSGLAASLVTLGDRRAVASLVCPRCGSAHTETISQFGSTPCKSLHRCLDCREPFDHFKCH